MRLFQDARFNVGHYDEIAISTSTHGGTSWSASTRVDTPTSWLAFNPSVRVNAAGSVAVTYCDIRNLTPGNTANRTEVFASP